MLASVTNGKKIKEKEGENDWKILTEKNSESQNLILLFCFKANKMVVLSVSTVSRMHTNRANGRQQDDKKLLLFSHFDYDKTLCHKVYKIM